MQVESAEKLLLQLSEVVFGLVVKETGGQATQELWQLQGQLLAELNAVMQPAAVNRSKLHPSMARPSRCFPAQFELIALPREDDTPDI